MTEKIVDLDIKHQRKQTNKISPVQDIPKHVELVVKVKLKSIKNFHALLLKRLSLQLWTFFWKKNIFFLNHL